MTDIDEIERAHNRDWPGVTDCGCMACRTARREAALIAKVRELEKDALKSHEDYRTQLNEIVRCHDKIKQLEKDRAGLVAALKEIMSPGQAYDYMTCRSEIEYNNGIAENAIEEHGGNHE